MYLRGSRGQVQGGPVGVLAEFRADFKEHASKLLGLPPAGLGVFESDHLGPGHEFRGHHDDMAP